ncbi:MAG: GTP-binding protein [Candidatus Freyarchaeota archaeon]|nr:GTP-binding protein [Candidatus Jordarchaeia archaeon]MBS7268554.1 GTP-binding protein [Candidatus Jordarchaeia archaeon]MBS7279262.1 GTP-binding protein [Candidatus Jordarchaeia archaeon]
MIREVSILDSNGKILFSKRYGQSSVSAEAFNEFVSALALLVPKLQLNGDIEFMNLKRTRLYYSNSDSIVFTLEADKRDAVPEIKEKLQTLKNTFLKNFQNDLNEWKEENSAKLEPLVDEITMTYLKISLIGYSGVGKTTILKLLREEELPKEHIPTIGVGIKGVKGARIGNTSLICWDLAGQERFELTWDKFIRDSSLIIIVTDSTLENVVKSRYFVRLIKDVEPEANVFCISNKQDLPNALSPEKVEQIMEIETHGLVAIDPMNRVKLYELIRKYVMGM